MKFESPIFSFFRFYYNVIRRSPKIYEDVMDDNTAFYINLTPFIFMFAYLISSLIMFPSLIVYLFLFIPVILLNTSYVFYLRDSKITRDRKKKEEEYVEYEKAEQRRMREYEEQLRKWDEERKQREMDELFERLLRDHINNQRQQQKQQQNQRQQSYTQQRTVDNNRVNAMKLMSLQDGFTASDLKSSYRKLSKIHHPDVGGLEANFKKLKKAYDYLSERM